MLSIHPSIQNGDTTHDHLKMASNTTLKRSKRLCMTSQYDSRMGKSKREKKERSALKLLKKGMEIGLARLSAWPSVSAWTMPKMLLASYKIICSINITNKNFNYVHYCNTIILILIPIRNIATDCQNSILHDIRPVIRHFPANFGI